MPNPTFTPGPYERDGCTVYKLEGTGRYSGKGADYKEDRANRFSAHVQGNRSPESERQAVAALFAAAPELYATLRDCVDALRRERGDRTLEDDAEEFIGRAALALVDAPVSPTGESDGEYSREGK